MNENISVIGLRRCSLCREYKEFDKFSKDRTNKSGLQHRCIECHTEYKRNLRGTPVRRSYAQIENDAFGYWFSGLCDGESHFAASINTTKGYFNLAIKFSIGLRLDDISTLEYISNNLKIGRVRNHHRWKVSTPLQQHQASFTVSEAQQLREVLVPLFDRYPLRTKKKRDYAIWREIVLRFGWNGKREDFWKGNPRFTSEEFDEVQKLCSDLKNVRKYIEPEM